MLGNIPIMHSTKFWYLGSIISESGGVGDEIATRINKALAALNISTKIWVSPLATRAKVKLFKSRIVPVLNYATECGNHTQQEIQKLAVFLNQS